MICRASVVVTDLRVMDDRIIGVVLAPHPQHNIQYRIRRAFFVPVDQWLQERRCNARVRVTKPHATMRAAFQANTLDDLAEIEITIQFRSVADMVHFKLALGSDYRISEIK